MGYVRRVIACRKLSARIMGEKREAKQRENRERAETRRIFSLIISRRIERILHPKRAELDKSDTQKNQHLSTLKKGV
jgi:hypothetical protein